MHYVKKRKSCLVIDRVVTLSVDHSIILKIISHFFLVCLGSIVWIECGPPVLLGKACDPGQHNAAGIQIPAKA